ncbi:MAG TPA: galactokinase [Candidatus Limnocylindrales bacterium]|nr:galactokinase [Candidatus Limnocylindrales bacterium]
MTPAELADAVRAAHPAARREAVRIVRAPGRVNLIGEHTDYNEGFVLPAAIDREVRIGFVAAGDGRVELVRSDTGERAGMALDAERRPDGTWFDYVAGVALELHRAGLEPGGLRGVVTANLPMNAGLSSSAAFELAAAWVLLGDRAADVEPLELARICQRAENEYVGVRCGLMDQFASACGVRGSALLLDCRSLDWRSVRLPQELALVVLHSGSSRSLGASAYNTRRAECEAGVAAAARLDPAVRSLRDVTPELLAAAAGAMDDVVLRRCRHVVAENERVGAAVAALESSDHGALGALFAAGHASLRDLFEVSSPELDALVEIAVAVPGVVAARMTGAGFGGCTVNLVRPDAVGALRAAVAAGYTNRTGLVATVLEVDAAAGAGPLTEARG